MAAMLILWWCLLLNALVAAAGSVFPAQCEPEGTCRCDFANGEYFDLSPLAEGFDGKPRFSAIIPEMNYTFFYQPCKSFQLGDKSSSSCAVPNGVATCRVEDENATKTYDGFGIQESATFMYDQNNQSFLIRYTQNDSHTDVYLRCTRTNVKASLFYDSYDDSNKTYKMSFNSSFSCINDAPYSSHGLSAGSVMLIILAVVAGIYFIGGCCFKKFYVGANSWEIIPHNEFWMDFPYLVKDGIVFVFKGCKSEPVYDRI